MPREPPFTLFFRTGAQIEDDGHAQPCWLSKAADAKKLRQSDIKMVSHTGVNSPKPK